MSEPASSLPEEVTLVSWRTGQGSCSGVIRGSSVGEHWGAGTHRLASRSGGLMAGGDISCETRQPGDPGSTARSWPSLSVRSACLRSSGESASARALLLVTLAEGGRVIGELTRGEVSHPSVSADLASWSPSCFLCLQTSHLTASRSTWLGGFLR